MKHKRVAILAYPQLCIFEFGCAVELFALPRPDLENWYQTDIVSLESDAVTATGRIQIQSDIVFSVKEGFKNYDMLVIPGWSGVDVKVSGDLINAIRSFYKNGGTLVSFCSGAFVLAATGLLNNKNATTHWRYEESFKQQFSQITFQENVLYSEEDNIYTSAGSASALDLGLHIIRQDYGVNIANEVAKRLVISPQREGGQAQYANKVIPQKNNHLSKSLQWANENLHNNININQMAEHACLSRRSFDRHFRSSFGISPKEWLIKQRISLARDFLESSQVGIEVIAEKSGFGSAMNLRHHFAQILGVSPSHYRNQFLQG